MARSQSESTPNGSVLDQPAAAWAGAGDVLLRGCRKVECGLVAGRGSAAMESSGATRNGKFRAVSHDGTTRNSQEYSTQPAARIFSLLRGCNVRSVYWIPADSQANPGFCPNSCRDLSRDQSFRYLR